MGLISCSRDSLASLSAISFPSIPTWLGIQHNTTSLPWRSISLYLSRNFKMSGLDKSSFWIDWRQDRESVKIKGASRIYGRGGDRRSILKEWVKRVWPILQRHNALSSLLDRDGSYVFLMSWGLIYVKYWGVTSHICFHRPMQYCLGIGIKSV